MSRQVRGSFFADYVRTVRRNRDANWKAFLTAEDLAMVEKRVSLDAWYPMASFERIGIAILNLVADWSFAVPYAWGRVSAEQLTSQFPNLVVPKRPAATILQLHGLRGMFFSFDPIVVSTSTDLDVQIAIDYGMRDVPEAAACYQAMGFYEAIVGLSGGESISAKFSRRRWEGHDDSTLALSWKLNVELHKESTDESADAKSE